MIWFFAVVNHMAGKFSCHSYFYVDIVNITESNKYWHCLKSVKDGWNETQNCKLFQYKLYLVISMHVSYMIASSNRLFLQVSLKHNRML